MSVKSFLTGLAVVLVSISLSLVNVVGENRAAASNYIDAITEFKANRTSLGQGAVLDVVAKFALNDGEAKAGDVTMISLPNQAKFYATAPIEIPLKNESGVIFGVANFMPAEKRIIITYKEAVETHQNITGSLLIKTQIDQKVVPESTEIDLGFNVNGKIMPVGKIKYTVHLYAFNPENIKKYGWQDPRNDRRILYFIDVNQLHENHENVQIRDFVQTEGAKIVPETVVIQSGKWKFSAARGFVLVGENGQDGTAPINMTGQFKHDGKINFTDGNKGFVVEIGNLEGRGFKIRYSVECPQACAGKIANQAGIYSGDNLIQQKSLEVSANNSQGQADGNVPTPPIKPEVPANPENPAPNPQPQPQPQPNPQPKPQPQPQPEQPAEPIEKENEKSQLAIEQSKSMMLAPNTGIAKKSDNFLLIAISFVLLVGLSLTVRKTEF